MLTGGLNWENKKIVLREAVEADNIEEIAIGYGSLVEVSIDFLIIALTVFVIVRFVNSLKNKAQDVNDPTVKTPKDIELLNQTVELLKQQNEILKSKVN